MIDVSKRALYASSCVSLTSFTGDVSTEGVKVDNGIPSSDAAEVSAVWLLCEVKTLLNDKYIKNYSVIIILSEK